jgi:transposase InsO family protein
MELGRFLVESHLREGRPVAELAAAHGVHRSWIYKLLARYRAEGEAGLELRSRRPTSSPTRIADLYEDEIVALRKELAEAGFDAGAVTIQVHLSRRHHDVPSVSTIWRVLKARGFVTPQPHKRPRSSLVRFVADLPNECWQMDVTHVELASGRAVEVLNVIDDHSRVCVASVARPVFTSPKVVASFLDAAGQWGFPAAVLSDNGAIFTAAYRNGMAAMESTLLSLGIEFRHSRPYHPQTCGKIERFHQTLKKYLVQQDPPATVRQLQTQLDAFVDYYNDVRPHRSLKRQTPTEAFAARVKASPRRPSIDTDGYRVRHDRVDKTGTITLRYRSRLRHIGIGRAHAGTRVIVLSAGPEVRVLLEDGQLISQLTIDPTRDYQPQGPP